MQSTLRADLESLHIVICESASEVGLMRRLEQGGANVNGGRPATPPANPSLDVHLKPPKAILDFVRNRHS